MLNQKIYKQQMNRWMFQLRMLYTAYIANLGMAKSEMSYFYPACS